MRITTIIPLYNAKDTIKSTLESVLNQTYSEPIEIIVINDGSSDGCEKIVEQMIEDSQTNRIIKLINKSNGGVSSARNRGIKEASGEWIAFLDSDDMWHPQKLEIISKILEDGSIAFLGHSYTLENNFHKLFEYKKPLKTSFTKLLLKNFAVTPSIVLRKDICEYFDEDMTHTEDHELWLRTALKMDVYYVDLPLTTLGRPQLSKGGLSSNRWAMRKGELQMYKNMISYKKSLFPLYPFLVIFSLTKHLRHILKGFFAKD
ncbi:MAG: glycosyltransferase family A protein [Campylobacterales bacterium]|jgi:glycosyltransferase involved in cell wall biosynthesis|nr:glycosyltransferase family A protein [Campylobacterales bacterium]